MNPLISPARSYPALRSGGGSIEFGITPLVPGQAYIDVVLATSLSSTIWDTVCSVVNTDDPAPLNIWPGVISAKSTTGFTVQLNGLPDSANYFLHWTIIPGASAPAVAATTYLLSGPGSGAAGAASTPFTVNLPSGGTVPAPVTITPHDGGGGTFTPATVSLTTAAPSATFTYTASSAGTKTISVTNSGGLTDPGSLTYVAAAGVHLLNTLISYWKLDEASGTRADSQGTNSLTAINGTLGAAGKINNGANFVSASSQKLTHADNSDLRVSSDFTFSAWVKITTQAGGYVFIKNNDPSSFQDYQMAYDPTQGFYFGAGRATAFADAAVMGAPVSNGVWTHIVSWYDSGTGHSYMRVNDTTTYASINALGPNQTASAFFIGGGDSLNFINALIDEVGFWKRKLNAAEITALYNSGAGLPYGSFTA